MFIVEWIYPDGIIPDSGLSGLNYTELYYIQCKGTDLVVALAVCNVACLWWTKESYKQQIFSEDERLRKVIKSEKRSPERESKRVRETHLEVESSSSLESRSKGIEEKRLICKQIAWRRLLMSSSQTQKTINHEKTFTDTWKSDIYIYIYIYIYIFFFWFSFDKKDHTMAEESTWYN